MIVSILIITTFIIIATIIIACIMISIIAMHQHTPSSSANVIMLTMFTSQPHYTQTNISAAIVLPSMCRL